MPVVLVEPCAFCMSPSCLPSSTLTFSVLNAMVVVAVPILRSLLPNQFDAAIAPAGCRWDFMDLPEVAATYVQCR